MTQTSPLPATLFRQIGTLCLAIAATGRALWMLARRRQPRALPSSPSRVACASLMLAAVLPSLLRAQRPEGVMCYDMAAPPKPQVSPMDRLPAKLNQVLKALWLALDQEKGEEFRKQIEAATHQKRMEKHAGDLLALAHQKWAMHKYRTRGAGKSMTCYMVMPAGVPSWERAVAQLELLAKARKEGHLDEDTADRAVEALAKELEILDPEGSVQKGGSREAIKTGDVKAGPSAIKAAETIVEWEGGPSGRS